jgi:hypothetical protein
VFVQQHQQAGECVVSSQILVEQVNKGEGRAGKVLMAVVMKLSSGMTPRILVENNQRKALPWLMNIDAADQVNPCGICVRQWRSERFFSEYLSLPL